MKMLNLQYRIVAAESELLPDHGFICLVYAPKADTIVLNDDCSSLDQVVEFITNYLALDGKAREKGPVMVGLFKAAWAYVCPGSGGRDP